MTTVLIAPDSFKGSLTSVQVATALADGWRQARPDDEILLCPLADGGEGTLQAIAAAGGWQWRRAAVTDPIGRPIEARWLQSDDGGRAVLEMAEASGLSRLAPAERDPIGATTAGTGLLLRAAIEAGVRHVTLGIGGTATTDGGRGLLTALGDETELGAIELEVACDVANPLLGPDGAAAVYGPQKGATPDDVVVLDARNAAWADDLEERTSRSERDTPGAGAAGGVGFALLASQDRFAAFSLRPGVDLLMEAVDFPARLTRADLVITGEGRIDAQTGFGKTALGVARRAQAAGVPCVAVGGGVEVAGIEALAAVGAIAIPVVERPQTVDAAMAAGVEPLVRCGERLARLVSLV
jgi:glycerate kinase